MKVEKISFSKLKQLNKNGTTYKNYELKGKTTFRIGGKCLFYLKICTIENFIKVMIYLESKNHKPFIMGNGSNLLVADKGYDGVVISLGGDFARVEMLDDIFECGAGVSLGVAFAKSKSNCLGGFEDAAGLPASIGGAVCMNAQAYGFEIAKIVEYVVAYVNGRISYFENADCEFSYRHSVFQENGAIILRVGFRLVHKEVEELEMRFLEVIQKRKECQPLEYGSAGCVFKRRDDIIVSKALEEDGFKGMSVGGAMVSLKHSNFIINYNNATAQDVYTLIRHIQNKFYEMHKIKLECEIKFLGDFDETIG